MNKTIKIGLGAGGSCFFIGIIFAKFNPTLAIGFFVLSVLVCVSMIGLTIMGLKKKNKGYQEELEEYERSKEQVVQVKEDEK